MGSANPPSPPPEPPALDGSTLTFGWDGGRERRFRKLVGFCFLSLLGHAVVFYFIQVVTPQPGRVLPPQAEVMLLHGDNPVSSVLLTGLDDRAAAYWGATRTLASEEVQIEDYTVAYRPSFTGFEPALRMLDPEPAPVSPPPLDIAGSFGLPPVDLGDGQGRAADGRELPRPAGAVGEPGEAGEASAAPPVRVKAAGGLAGRPVAMVPMAEPNSWSGAGSGRVVFIVGVDRAGAVRAQIPLEIDLPDAAAVAGFVGAVRFAESKPGADELEWGTLEVGW